MSPLRFALFATAIGECALAWNDVGLVGVWLPETRSGDLRRRLERRFPHAAEAAPAGSVVDAIASIRQLLDGVPVDLRAIALDWSVVPEAARRVYELTREIAPGRVVTYGAIARALGGEVDARSVGQALGANPFTIVVPCHRVIGADGRLGGFSAPGGAAQKQRLLAIERARPDGPPGLFDDPCSELSPPAESATAARPTRAPPAR
ncbi:MAG: methylated-DNA--[protein]-cysteine S-methyltransferase [Caldimonas sp.]